MEEKVFITMDFPGMKYPVTGRDGRMADIRDLIDEADLFFPETGHPCSGIGREPYVTAAILPVEGFDPEELAETIGNVAEYGIIVTGAGVFENGECDVLMLTVEGDGLRRLHRELSPGDDGPYRPYVPVATLKKGLGWKYVPTVQHITVVTPKGFSAGRLKDGKFVREEIA